MHCRLYHTAYVCTLGKHSCYIHCTNNQTKQFNPDQAQGGLPYEIEVYILQEIHYLSPYHLRGPKWPAAIF